MPVKQGYRGRTAITSTWASTSPPAKSSGKKLASTFLWFCSCSHVHGRYYTWSPWPVKTGLEFVPMLWGTDQLSDWDSSINQTIQNLHVTHALGFNEPEISGQSNISPSDAATLWKAHLEPLKAQGSSSAHLRLAAHHRESSGCWTG